MILHALGVAKAVIDEDYLLTNRYYRRDPAAASTDLPENVRAVLATVDGSFLAAAFDAVRAEYGDIDRYLTNGLGVGARERAALEARYLS